VLQLIERIARSEGATLRRFRRPEDQIKRIHGYLNTEEMLAPYKKMHPAYFKIDASTSKPISPPRQKSFMEVLLGGATSLFSVVSQGSSIL
jgi:hypothetical protein